MGSVMPLCVCVWSRRVLQELCVRIVSLVDTVQPAAQVTVLISHMLPLLFCSDTNSLPIYLSQNVPVFTVCVTLDSKVTEDAPASLGIKAQTVTKVSACRSPRRLTHLLVCNCSVCGPYSCCVGVLELPECAALRCQQNARCMEEALSGQLLCQCLPGYQASKDQCLGPFVLVQMFL